MVIIGSKLRQKIYSYFFTNPEQSLYVRELARLLKEDPSNLAKELKKLEKEGIFISKIRGKEKYYSLNKSYPLYEELKKIIFKTIGVEGNLKEALLKIEGIKSAFIFGSYAKGKEIATSDIDLFIIGIPDENELIKQINNLERKLNREINYYIYPEKELQKKIKEKDSFVKSVILGSKIILVGKENDLPRFD